MTKQNDDQLALFQGFRPVGMKFSLSGAVTNATEQPTREMVWSEEVTLIVRGYVKQVGYGGTPEDPGPTLHQQVVVTSAFEIDEDDAERLIADGRKRAAEVLDRRLGETYAEAG